MSRPGKTVAVIISFLFLFASATSAARRMGDAATSARGDMITGMNVEDFMVKQYSRFSLVEGAKVGPDGVYRKYRNKYNNIFTTIGLGVFENYETAEYAFERETQYSRGFKNGKVEIPGGYSLTISNEYHTEIFMKILNAFIYISADTDPDNAVALSQKIVKALNDSRTSADNFNNLVSAHREDWPKMEQKVERRADLFVDIPLDAEDTTYLFGTDVYERRIGSAVVVEENGYYILRYRPALDLLENTRIGFYLLIADELNRVFRMPVVIYLVGG